MIDSQDRLNWFVIQCASHDVFLFPCDTCDLVHTFYLVATMFFPHVCTL